MIEASEEVEEVEEEETDKMIEKTIAEEIDTMIEKIIEEVNIENKEGLMIKKEDRMIENSKRIRLGPNRSSHFPRSMKLTTPTPKSQSLPKPPKSRSLRALEPSCPEMTIPMRR